MKNFTTGVRLFLAVLLMLSCFQSQLWAQFSAKQVTASNGLVVPFLEHKPATHDASAPTKKYPVIIFLHGGGECSTNLSLTSGSPVWELRNWGPNAEIDSGYSISTTWNGQLEEFIVLQPMARSISNPWPPEFVNAMITHASITLKGDTNRIYLTGHSFGGAGTFNYLNSSSANALKLAAAAPISCWNIPLNTTGANNVSAAKLPVWAFHATDDGIAPVTMTTNSITTLNAVNPAVKPLSTIWPTGYIQSSAHGSAPLYVYNLHLHPYLENGVINIYEWFLGQNKSLPVNVRPIAVAGNDLTISNAAGNTATLNGSASYDTDGSIVRYVWRKIAGPAGGTISTPFGTTSSTTVSGLTTTGTYTYQLNVVDNRAAIARDTIQVTVADSSAFGKAIAITATGGRIIAGNISQLINASAFTFEAYVKHDGIVTDWTNGEANIARTYTSATDRVKLAIDKATNSVHFTVANGADVKGYTASNVVSPNTWYHIAAVYDGAQATNTNRLKIYINGVSQTLTFTGTIPATTSASTTSYWFGGEPSSSKVVAIDEVRVWTTTIPQATISAWKDKQLANCHPNFNSLKVYWPLNDGASTATAALGTAYPGGFLSASYISSPLVFDLDPCPPGKAIAITATGGRIIAGNISQLINASAFTFEAYVKHDGIVTDWTNGEANIARTYTSATDRVKLAIDKSTNSVHFTVANGADVKGYTASNVVSPNTWYHIAAVYDGAQATNTNRLKIYINGVSQTLTFTGTIPATTSGSTTSYWFGGEPSSSKVVAIDEVRVWTTTIPQATISAWKDKQLGNCHPNFNTLKVYWPLDDGASTATAALGTAYPGGFLSASYIGSSQASDASGCGAIMAMTNVTERSQDRKPITGKAYPNPTKDIVQIELNAPIDQLVRVNVFDLFGRPLIRNSKPVINGSNKISLNIASLPAGTYIIEIRDGKTLVENYKVLKL